MSPSLLKDGFAEHIILDWRLFCLQNVDTMLLTLASTDTVEKSAYHANCYFVVTSTFSTFKIFSLTSEFLQFQNVARDGALFLSPACPDMLLRPTDLISHQFWNTASAISLNVASPFSVFSLRFQFFKNHVLLFVCLNFIFIFSNHLSLGVLVWVISLIFLFSNALVFSSLGSCLTHPLGFLFQEMHTHTSARGYTHKRVRTFQLPFANLPDHFLWLVHFYVLILYCFKHFSHIVQTLVVPGALKLLLVLTA